ncbi:MAG TPA: beta-propeller fold lactonase family protein [Verrucomicrobiae bacterium]|jgi:DNA-binding beta-propeller fold protein YncE/predicted secreted protein
MRNGILSKKHVLAILAGAAIGFVGPQTSLGADGPILRPGPQPDGSMLLPNLWSLQPAGSQVELDDFPVNIAVHPGGKFVAILHCGFSPHEVVMVDLEQKRVVSRTHLDEAFYGITFSPDGKQLYCGGSSTEQVFAFNFSDGNLSEARHIRLRDRTETGVPAGVAVDASGKTLFAANLWRDTISRVNLSDNTVREIALTTNVHTVTLGTDKPEEDSDTAAATKRAKAIKIAANPDACFPYTCLVDSRNNRLYVSLWARSEVAVVDLKSGQVVAHWQTGHHPCEMALKRKGDFLFVANANDNTVTVIDTKSGRPAETIWAALFPNALPGSTPNSLALSPDEKLLFVANANVNAVAVFNVENPGKSRSLGFIPVGWYPTSVRVTPDGRHLLVTNGKGNEARANPNGPQPTRESARDQYIAKLFQGTLSIIDLPSEKNLARQMADWTAQTMKCSPLREDSAVHAARPEGNPVPLRPGDGSPIKHCIYVIKENRTYDQVFGDIAEGNGDAALCLFPERVTPNHHKLAREFVLLDNFYVESEVSADGHEWSTAAYASDYVEKTWPLNYGHKNTKFPYPSEGLFPIAYPSSGYLWDKAKEAGVSYRSYGEFVQNGEKPGMPAVTRLKNLEDHFDPGYRSFDLSYSDTNRAARFLSELKRYEQEGDMPALQIVRLPNDHTHGVTVGQLTPTAYVADNDAGLGQLVDGVSRSKFWPSTAIFIVEDDAQNGPDHVDAHRTVALVVSPYTRRHKTDSTLYSTSSMLRTMELIVGMKPMTQFDAAAAPMYNSFAAQPDVRPYEALPANVDLRETNTVGAWGSKIKFNFAKEDQADDLVLNEMIWRSVRGAKDAMPAPIRAGFVMVNSPGDDD